MQSYKFVLMLMFLCEECLQQKFMHKCGVMYYAHRQRFNLTNFFLFLEE